MVRSYLISLIGLDLTLMTIFKLESLNLQFYSVDTIQSI